MILTFKNGINMKTIKNYIKMKTKIYSLKYGVGEIIGIYRLYDGINDYIEVKFYSENNGTRLFPQDFKSELRVISNPIELTFMLKRLHAKITDSGTINKLSSYQRIGTEMGLGNLIGVISNLLRRVELKDVDKKLLTQCMDSLVSEVGHVFKINDKRARGIVSEYIKVA